MGNRGHHLHVISLRPRPIAYRNFGIAQLIQEKRSILELSRMAAQARTNLLEKIVGVSEWTEENEVVRKKEAYGYNVSTFLGSHGAVYVSNIQP